MPTPNQLTGGHFQDAEGNALAFGYLILELSQDGSVGGLNICAGVEITVPLDSGGSATGSVSVWGNDQILPQNSYYRVTGYTAQGQPAWGPNNQQVIGGGGTFDLATWIPNQIYSWSPPLSSTAPVLETNGTQNVVQTLLDLEEGSNISLVDNGDGSVTINATQSGWQLRLNGSNEAPSPHSVVNFVNGNGIKFSDNGSGTVTWNLSGFATSNQGFFLGGKDFMPVADDSGGFWDNSTSAVYAVQFNLPVPYLISRISAMCITGGSGAFSCGIYDATGATKLIDAGTNAFSVATSGGFRTVSLGSPISLPAGTYWFAFGAPSTTSGASIVTHQLGTWMASLINGIDVSNPQTNPTRLAITSRTTSGAMPASLGVLTPLDHTNPQRIPAVVFAV